MRAERNKFKDDLKRLSIKHEATLQDLNRHLQTEGSHKVCNGKILLELIVMPMVRSLGLGTSWLNPISFPIVKPRLYLDKWFILLNSIKVALAAPYYHHLYFRLI